MGESACLRRSLSHPSSAFRHPPEGDPLRCLTESVSFGRFVSESSLAWERWSAFSHNRHLEEVQQISRAGSVAEKKAFFEAHYKRRAAAMKDDAAKLEQANANAGTDPAEPDSSGGTCISVSLASSQQSMETANPPVFPDAVGTSSRTSGSTFCVSPANLQQLVETVNVTTSVPDAEIDHSADVKCVLDIGQSDQVEGYESVEPSVSLEDQMQVEHAESSETDKVAAPPEERTAAHEDAGQKENVALRASSKRLMNPSRITSTHRAPKLPRAGGPSSGNTSPGFTSKNNSGSKALHMSIRFSSCSGEKIRISPQNSKASKPEQCIRNNLTVNKSIFGRNISSGILQTAAADCSGSSISNGSKPKPPTVSSPFRFRSDERAAKRREKLKERCNASEAENIHQEGKQRCKITKTQQSTNFGSRLDEAPSNESKLHTRTTKMSVVTPQPPKSGRKPPSSKSTHERRFIPPQRTLESAALPKRKLISLSVTSSPQRKRGHENAPPNIQR